MNKISSYLLAFSLSILLFQCHNKSEKEQVKEGPVPLRLEENEDGTQISVYRQGDETPIVTQNAKEDFRPYLHPIEAPDGKGTLTEYSPGHHKHQTGLYWGFTRVNGTGAPIDTIHKYFYQKEKYPDIAKRIGRDFFHHPEGEYWRKESSVILKESGEEVKWETVYYMLDQSGAPILKETQDWTMQLIDNEYILSLEWSGEALTDITIGEFDYGGLFLRMPWKEGIKGEVVNAARQKNKSAEGQRAMWVDVSMQVEGRDDLAHIAIFDHTDNGGFPQPWRVDSQLGVGPVRARLGDWEIKEGEVELIKHQIRVYTGELNDVGLAEKWQSYVDGHMYSVAALWDLARQEGRNAKFLNPEEAVEAMTVTPGFKVNAWAGEPMITQPIAFCWDNKGRLWVAENRDYENRGEGFSNSGDSRVLIIEDTDKDGIADSRKVFLEGIPFPSAIAVGFDGLFLAAPPNLLFVPDKNKDDKAEMDDIEVRLTGWGIRDRHETINSFHWGPDGWLYGLEGFATPSKIRKPVGEGHIYKHREAFPKDLLEADGVDINGGVWRYHPTKDIFEVVAHGFSNPWGIDYDEKGQLFITACVIPHLWHVIPGGIYQRQGGSHFNPYLYSDIQTIGDHRHRSAHGGARIYLSDAYPEDQYGRIFMANIHEHAVLSDILSRKGSGYTGTHGQDFVLANNAQWIGFSMELGPEGDLYVLDWHDADICGNEVVHKETGRVFKISPEQSNAENWDKRYEDLETLNDLELARLQLKKSSWHARRARVILQNRASKAAIDPKSVTYLNQLLDENDDENIRLRALWTLFITNSIQESALERLLNDKDEYVRSWAIQFIVEDKKISPTTLKKFTEMAKSDPSAVVRLYLSAALQRLELNQRWDLAAALASRKEDVGDHNLPKMIWYGTEPLVPTNPDKAMEMASNARIPMITQYISRRMVDADQLEKLVAWSLKSGKNQMNILQGLRDGIESQPDAKAPANWETAYETLQDQGQAIKEISLEIAQFFGDAKAAEQFMLTLKDKTEDPEKRITALEGLAKQQWHELPKLLPSLLNDENLRTAAIKAFAAFDGNQLGNALMKKYDDFNATDKLEVVQTMSSRSGYGWILTRAIKEETIPKSDIPAYAARQLRRVVGNGFVEVWGPIDQLSGNQKALYEKYTDLLTDENIANANISNGRLVFQQTCGPCHQMYGEGGTLGPDLTGSNRQNREYLLSNVLDPSGEIQEGYKMVVLTTRDGRTYSGNIASENDRNIALSMIGQDTVNIAKSNIQSKEVTSVSMMPAGLWETLSSEQVLDLVGYLRTTKQVELP